MTFPYNFYLWLLLILVIAGGCLIIALCFLPFLYALYLGVLNVWHNRTHLNSRCHGGRWVLLGIGLSLMSFIGLWVGSDALKRQKDVNFRNLVAPPAKPKVVSLFSESYWKQIEAAREEYRQRLEHEIWLEKTVGAVGLLTGVCIFSFLALRCFALAKRFAVRPASETLSEDTRAPVLYLRSFKDDSKVAKRLCPAEFSVNCEEGEIAEIVRTIGPLVAVGRPGEELSYCGAARLHFGEGSWQESISKLLPQAPFVIVRAGRTSGLSWAIEQCVKRVQPERLIVFIPLGGRAYDEFRESTAEFFPCRLPEYMGRWALGHTAIRAILYFDPDWAPHMVPIIKSYLLFFCELEALATLFRPGRQSQLR
jgi:hypothetical protein